MNIRKMEAEDLDQVAAIEADSFSRPWSRNAFEDSMKLSNYIFLVAEVNHEILGYCGLVCTEDDGNITSIAVKKEVRNKGIGYGIVEAMIDEAKTKGLKAMTLEVRKSNSSAIRLYEQVGFKSAGLRKNYYEAPREDAVIMWKENL